MPQATVHLLRHGEVYNPDGVLYGRLPEFHLSELGQEMDFKILRIEQADQKIGLSARAVGKEDEPIVDSKMYSTEAKGGMASLGELANLNFGGTAEEAVPEETPEEKKAAKLAAKKIKAEEYAAKQAEAANSLFAQGVDVITQHQDCTDTIIKATEGKGMQIASYADHVAQVRAAGRRVGHYTMCWPENGWQADIIRTWPIGASARAPIAQSKIS